MYKVNFACLFFGYLNRNSHAHEHFTCTGTLPVPVHRYRGILRSLLCFDDIYTVGGDKEAKTREEGRSAPFNAPGKRRSHLPGI